MQPGSLDSSIFVGVEWWGCCDVLCHRGHDGRAAMKRKKETQAAAVIRAADSSALSLDYGNTSRQQPLGAQNMHWCSESELAVKTRGKKMNPFHHTVWFDCTVSNYWKGKLHFPTTLSGSVHFKCTNASNRRVGMEGGGPIKSWSFLSEKSDVQLAHNWLTGSDWFLSKHKWGSLERWHKKKNLTSALIGLLWPRLTPITCLSRGLTL